MVKEFTGATEKEAIEIAIQELGIGRDEFDVEIIEKSKKGIFSKGPVKIKVYYEENKEEDFTDLHTISDAEEKIIIFLNTIIEKMGIINTSSFITKRQDNKVIINIETEDPNLIIGKKGKNLDALQSIINIYSNKVGVEEKIVLDVENYREKRELFIENLAKKTAVQVRRTKSSILLEPLNPFERRIIHTTLNDYSDIDTISEGDGLYKQVRVIYKKNFTI